MNAPLWKCRVVGTVLAVGVTSLACVRQSAAQPATLIPPPGFVACVPVAGFGTPIALAIGDFDRDGSPDIAILDTANSQVHVRLTDRSRFAVGDCEGALHRCGAHCDYAAGKVPTALAAGDIRGDGKLDLAIANQDGVSILTGDGTGSFTVDATPHPAGSFPKTVAIADVDGDGLQDIVVGSGSENSVTILFGSATATGGFDSPPTVVAVNGSVSTLVVQDFNNDGLLDMAIGVDITSTVSVLLQVPGKPRTFAPPVPFDAGVVAVAMAAADFNFDGTLDLAVGGGGSAGRLSGFLGHIGTGGSVSYTPEASTSSSLADPVALAVDDFNRDGKPDLVVVNRGNGTAAFFLGNGDGTFTLVGWPVCAGEPAGICGVGSKPQAVVLATATDASRDLDGDGFTDVIIANQADGSISILLSGQPGSTPSPTETGLPTQVSTPTPTASLTPTPGNCCSAHAGPNCSNTDCQTCVCNLDSPCCNQTWDLTCVQDAEKLCAPSCGCGAPTPTPTGTPSATQTPTATVTPTQTPAPNECCACTNPNQCGVPRTPGLCGGTCVLVSNASCVQGQCVTQTPTFTPTPTPTNSPLPTATATPTAATPTATPTRPATQTPSVTASPTAIPAPEICCQCNQGSTCGPPGVNGCDSSCTTVLNASCAAGQCLPNTPTQTVTPSRTVLPTQTQTPSVTFTNTPVFTPTPQVTATATAQCFAAGICVQGKSCAIRASDQSSRDIGGWLIPPLLLWLWRRAR